MFRTLLAILVGLLVMASVVALVQMGSHQLYPPPADIDPSDRAAMVALISSLPMMALVLVLASYALGSLAGAYTAARISARHTHGAAITIGFVMLALVVANFVMIPHPAWMVPAGVIIPLPFAWLGGRLA
jgi:hypothetical protein